MADSFWKKVAERAALAGPGTVAGAVTGAKVGTVAEIVKEGVKSIASS